MGRWDHMVAPVLHSLCYTVKPPLARETAVPLVATPPQRSTAERIAHTLACRIVRGEVAPGDRLPSVRALAAEHGTTVPTIHRAVERLAARGLVRTEDRRGTVVCDPAAGDLALLPVWFDAWSDDPDRSAALLADLLEVRRALAGHLVATHRGALLRALPAMAAPMATLASATDLAVIAAADAALTEAVVSAVGSHALRAVLHTVSRLALEVPHVAEALYADRPGHLAVVAAVAEGFARGEASALLAAMARWDAASVEAFRARLAAA